MANPLNNLSDLKPLLVGGQKEVYTGRHTLHGQIVFKKIKLKKDSLERARREIRAVELIKSSSVPKIFEHNCDESNPQNIWLIEEFIDGRNLRELLLSGETFELKDVVSFIDTVLEVLAKAEEFNLIHRDIKPENIILDKDNKFWLLDFGISRHLDLDSITPSANPYGLFTIGYASSEQFRNFKKDIDSRSDLFAVGVVAYELLNGSNFYMENSNGDVFKIIKKLESESLPHLALIGDLQFQLSAFIKMLGDHRRNRRPRTAKEAIAIFAAVKETLKI